MKYYWLYIHLLMISSIHSLWAQDINLAMQNYKSGQFAQAEREFIEVLKSARANELKNTALKYLGISQYMQGKKESAQRTFQALKRSDAKASISQSEVLDDSVITFFNGIRVTSPTQGSTTQRTGIFIESNVPNANVSMNGILAGTVGRHIDARSGIQEVTVTAPGFIGRKVRVNVAPQQSNKFRIDLSRPEPKATPRPPAPVATRTPPPAQPSSQPQRSQPAGVRDLFADQPEVLPPPGRDLATEFQLESQRQAAQPMMPPQQMYQPPQPMGFQQQPIPMQPMMPMYQPAPMYAPMYVPPPQPMYPQYPTQPYMYEPPYPQQSMSNPQPVAPNESFNPSQAAPPPTSFGPSERPSPPKRVRRVQNPNQRNQRSRNVARAPSRAERSPMQNQAQKTSSSGGSVVAALMPFGIGQFYNGDYFLGTLIAASQIGAITYSVYNMNEANTQIKVMEDYFNDPNATDADKEAFEKESKAYIQDKRAHQQYGLYGFVGLWAVGSIQALVASPNSSSSAEHSLDSSPVLAQSNGFEFGLLRTEPKNYIPALQFTWKH